MKLTTLRLMALQPRWVILSKLLHSRERLGNYRGQRVAWVRLNQILAIWAGQLGWPGFSKPSFHCAMAKFLEHYISNVQILFFGLTKLPFLSRAMNCRYLHPMDLVALV
ncbi:hypothetical protein ATY76_22445 [Rhizobium sp. R339]|nr:hypothetical protein ATY76_22445 [Rhizobium sp. R339]